MKTFFQKLILFLPLGFLLLALANMLFLHKYLFHTRHSDLQTLAFGGVVLSLFIALVYEAINSEPKRGYRKIYKSYIAIPLIVVMVLLTLASMNR
jgi:bacteriorhodopsin